MNMHSKQKRSFALAAKDLKGRRRPTLPRVVVPSARTGLTSLFGKVRGVPRRYSHPNFTIPTLAISFRDPLPLAWNSSPHLAGTNIVTYRKTKIGRAHV